MPTGLARPGSDSQYTIRVCPSLSRKNTLDIRDTTWSAGHPGRAINRRDGKAYSLAQKTVGKACGVTRILPGTYCEPKMTTVGSHDTSGPMTRDELKDLPCLGFSADLGMQSFCHTAAYPKLVEVPMHRELPSSISTRGGIAPHPGDGVMPLDMPESVLVRFKGEMQPGITLMKFAKSALASAG